MKVVVLVAALSLLVASGAAQPFQHVIIVIQENRTPDNLFGASGLPGADVVAGKPGNPISLTNGPDFSHTHAAYLTQASGIIQNAAYDYVASGVQPYWDIAAQYGFANYMYQTNQGASFPAHQFLVSATSAPSDTSDLFVSDNAVVGGEGCKTLGKSLVPTIAPDGSYSTVHPCFQRSSVMDLLDRARITWRYYAVAGKSNWDGPQALKNYAKSKNVVLNPPQILNDIKNGTLASVNWVTPASAYSDHPDGGPGGPAWVASIVNAVGQSQYWDNTAIVVTWDDWGGWSDHVPPLTNTTGWCAVYCYGFRVPLLVVSAVTPPGYVSNDVHDFGSIMRFVESNYGLGLIGPGTWADSYADDLSDFFKFNSPHRQFVPIKSRSLTKQELQDRGDPDSD